MRIHTYAADGGGAHTREVEPGARLREVLVIETDDELVYRVGDESEIDLDVTVAEVFGQEPGHLITHSCRKVAVTVVYAGAEKIVKVHPAVRLRKVRAKAVDEFDIEPADAADLALRLPGRDQDLDLAMPVGAIVPKGTCSVSLDLVHTVRPQG